MRIAAAGCGAVLTIIVAGCNTDPIWEPRQETEGPVARMDRPEGLDLPDIALGNVTEPDLVEQMMTHRAMYHRTLSALHDYYRDRGYESKRLWAARELAELKRVKPYRYVVAAEVPQRSLNPTQGVAEADAMYDRGLTLMKEGGAGIPIIYREQKMKQALQMFRELIDRFPSSDKVDDAAFYCGEIHKEYFNGDERLAVAWYERAVQWNPSTPHPVRFQAAVIYDYRLHDRDRALEFYRRVLAEERDNSSNLSFATKRIDEITRDNPTDLDPRRLAEDRPGGAPARP